MWGLAIKGALSAVSGLLSALVKWVGYFFAYKLGRSRSRAEAMERAKEIRDAQIEIMSKPLAHRAELLRRMHERERDD